MTEPIKWSNAPDRTSWGASMRVADIALDRDHTLTLYCEASQTAKVDAMFAEVERLREELARLTTLRPASEHDERGFVLWWDQDEAGKPLPICMAAGSLDFVNVPCRWFTPLPEPKETK